jgi:hypothetical protein
MVIGKLKYLIELGLEHTTILTLFPWAHGECKSSHSLASFRGSWTSVLEGGGPDPQPRKKGEKLHV